MLFLKSWKDTSFRESGIWERYYLPAKPNGLTVLDVGAGCGGTAAFYLSNGASKVIAIEKDPTAFAVLKSNIAMNSWNVEPVNGSFFLEQLGWRRDIMKMDIEGAERLLLGYNGQLQPLVLEAHSYRIAKNLVRKFNLKRVFGMGELGFPHLSLLHRSDSPLPNLPWKASEYLGMAKVALKEGLGGLASRPGP